MNSEDQTIEPGLDHGNEYGYGAMGEGQPSGDFGVDVGMVGVGGSVVVVAAAVGGVVRVAAVAVVFNDAAAPSIITDLLLVG